MRLFLALLIALSFSPTDSTGVAKDSYATIWIGTGGNGAKGIYRTRLNMRSGRLTTPELAAPIGSPGFLAIAPDGKKLWSLCRSETQGGSVAAFNIIGDADGLGFINMRPIGDGSGAHIAVDAEQQMLFSAQYGGGSVAAFPLESNGAIGIRSTLMAHEGSGPNTQRQMSPHPHWVGMGPNNQFLYVPDLGIDKIVIYKVDFENHKIKMHGYADSIPGAGPRHLTFHPNQRFAYLVNEMDMSVIVYSVDAAAGKLTQIQQISTLPKEMWEIPVKASEVRIHPTGNFLYVGNRGHDTLSVFRLDQDSGQLTFVEREPIRGSWPRHFEIDPTGKWLIAAGRYSNTLSVYRIDQNTGNLYYNSHCVNCPGPICVVFQPM